MDEQAYIVYHQASLGPPCLSFDIIPDELGKKYYIKLFIASLW